MNEHAQENENTSIVREAALTEAKKKKEEAKSFLRKFADASKSHIKRELNPEDMARKIQSGITNKVKSSLLQGKGPRAKSKR